MADYLSSYAVTAVANTSLGGINIQENAMTFPSINNAFRENMSHLKGFKNEFESGTDLTAQTVLLAGSTSGLFHDVTAASTPSISSIDTAVNDVNHMKLLHFNGTAKLLHSTALLLPNDATVQANPGDRFLFGQNSPGMWECYMKDISSVLVVNDDGSLNLVPRGSGTLKYASTEVVRTSLISEVATTSGTSVTIDSSVPSWAKTMTIMFEGVSTESNAEDYLIRLGDSGGVEDSGYTAGCGEVKGGSLTESTAGFIVGEDVGSTEYLSGQVTITMKDSTNFDYTASGSLVGNNKLYVSTGVTSLDTVATSITLTTAGGSNAFAAGNVSVLYRG